jgi:glucose-1-phosphate cytidylyltransferase
MTYGDGVSDVDIAKTIRFHKKQGRMATLTGVQPPGRFGALKVKGNRIDLFNEKPEGDGAWINGGFFVLEPSVIDLITDDATIWEREPLEALARKGELSIYRHHGFWQPMDALRDKNLLETLWNTGKAPWKVW